MTQKEAAIKELLEITNAMKSAKLVIDLGERGVNSESSINRNRL